MTAKIFTMLSRESEDAAAQKADNAKVFLLDVCLMPLNGLQEVEKRDAISRVADLVGLYPDAKVIVAEWLGNLALSEAASRMNNFDRLLTMMDNELCIEAVRTYSGSYPGIVASMLFREALETNDKRSLESIARIASNNVEKVSKFCDAVKEPCEQDLEAQDQLLRTFIKSAVFKTDYEKLLRGGNLCQ